MGQRIGLVTSTQERQVTTDDDRLLAALRARGLDADLVAWDDPAAAWDRYRLLVVRSTWNYHTQRERFVRWAYRTSRLSALWNPPRTLRWNTDKRYLRDLERSRIPIVPTRWFRAGARVNLGRLMTKTGWRNVVVKPVVSAGARNTFVFRSTSLAAGQKRLSALLRSRSMMVQPYMRSVETVGERSLIFLDGRFSHAVLRAPVLTGRKQSYDTPAIRATHAQLDLARRTLAACPEPTLYARVDMIRAPDLTWRIGEVELTEPFLYLSSRPMAADDLAAAIEGRLS